MLIPLHRFLKEGNELFVPFNVAHVVAQLKNYGGSIYVDDEFCHPQDGHLVADAILVTLDQDDPLLTLDYVLQNLKADEMSIEQYPENRYVRLWWD